MGTLTLNHNHTANELLMQEVRSGTYTSYGIIHGQGPHEWYTLAEMDYVRLKSILLFKSVGHTFVQMWFQKINDVVNLANYYDWQISTADITTAFLYGTLDAPIYWLLGWNTFGHEASHCLASGCSLARKR